MDNQVNIETLLEENKMLKQANEELTAKLKKYINNDAHKKYYENHKESMKETHYKYIDKMKTEDPEKYKQYRKEANKRYREKKKLNSNNTTKDEKIEE